jgi:hypothetical protein
MAHIYSNIYAQQDIVPRIQLESINYPDAMLAAIIRDQLEGFWQASVDKQEELDWSTLAISTRWDDLVNGLLVSGRVNAASS